MYLRRKRCQTISGKQDTSAEWTRRLTDHIVGSFEIGKSKVRWNHREVKENLEEIGIQRTEISKGDSFQFKIKITEGCSRKIRSRAQIP